jgi:hypothetical protein
MILDLQGLGRSKLGGMNQARLLLLMIWVNMLSSIFLLGAFGERLCQAWSGMHVVSALLVNTG